MTKDLCPTEALVVDQAEVKAPLMKAFRAAPQPKRAPNSCGLLLVRLRSLRLHFRRSLTSRFILPIFSRFFSFEP